MSVNPINYAFVGVDYEPSVYCIYQPFTGVEYTGSNAADIVTWASNEGISGANTSIIDDSGQLKVKVRAFAGPWVWASKFQGREVVADVPSGSHLFVQGNTFFGILHPDYVTSNFAELA